MHELSIAQALIEQIEAVSVKEVGAMVKRVILVNGPLSGVDGHALKLAFPIAAEDTCAKDAELVIEENEVNAYCKKCKSSFKPELPFMVCTECGALDTDIEGSRDLILKSLDF